MLLVIAARYKRRVNIYFHGATVWLRYNEMWFLPRVLFLSSLNTVGMLNSMYKEHPALQCALSSVLAHSDLTH